MNVVCNFNTYARKLKVDNIVIRISERITSDSNFQSVTKNKKSSKRTLEIKFNNMIFNIEHEFSDLPRVLRNAASHCVTQWLTAKRSALSELRNLIFTSIQQSVWFKFSRKHFLSSENTAGYYLLIFIVFKIKNQFQTTPPI